MTTTTDIGVGSVLDRCREENRAALVGYLPVGYPSVEGSVAAMVAMVEAGVDIVEVGIPYSDPLMDGPTIAHAADQGVRGCLVQVLDETEESFPFDGRMIFQSMGRSTEFETQRARALHEAYAARLAERRARLVEIARHLGWRTCFHDTTAPPRKALLWLYMAIGERA